MSNTDTQELPRVYESVSFDQILNWCQGNSIDPEVTAFLTDLEENKMGLSVSGNLIRGIAEDRGFDKIIVSYDFRELILKLNNIVAAVNQIWSKDAVLTPYRKPTLDYFWENAIREDYINPDKFLDKIITVLNNPNIVDLIKFCMANEYSNEVVLFITNSFRSMVGLRINKELIDLNAELDPTIHETINIDNPTFFAEKLNKVSELLKKSNKKKWTEGFRLKTLWANATSQDFVNPLAYLDRIIYMLEDTTFDSYLTWSEIGKLDSIERNLFFRVIVPNAAFESPTDMEFILTPNTEVDYTHQIHSVRFGVVSKDSVIVYAIQEPKYNDFTLNLIKRRLFIANENKGELLRLLRQNNVMKNSILGENVDLDYLETLEVEAFAVEFNRLVILKQKEDGIEPNIYQLLNSLGRSTDISKRMADMDTFLTSLPRVEQARKVINKRKRNFYKYDSFYKNSESEVTNTVMITSLLLALQVFKSKGFRKILIPSFLPYRQHTYDPVTKVVDEELSTNLDSSIQSSKHYITEMAEHFGDWIVTDYGDDGGYITLELKDSNNNDLPPIVNDIKLVTL